MSQFSFKWHYSDMYVGIWYGSTEVARLVCSPGAFPATFKRSSQPSVKSRLDFSQKVTSITDLNDVTATGFWALPPSIANLPANDWLAVLVMRVDGNPNYVTQLGVTIQGGYAYSRSKSGGTWGAWRNLAG